MLCALCLVRCTHFASFKNFSWKAAAVSKNLKTTFHARLHLLEVTSMLGYMMDPDLNSKIYRFLAYQQ